MIYINPLFSKKVNEFNTNVRFLIFDEFSYVPQVKSREFRHKLA